MKLASPRKRVIPSLLLAGLCWNISCYAAPDELALSAAEKVELSRKPIVLADGNFVERPWAGKELLTFKGIPSSQLQEHPSWAQAGESFELAAYPAGKDKEAGEHPSLATLPDGRQLPLLTLLAQAGEEVLGAAHLAQYGAEIPLLPKLLNIGQLLSVQTHPQGNPELYIVLAAAPGARLFVGFRNDLDDSAEFKQSLADARSAQEQLISLLKPAADQTKLYAAMTQYFSERASGVPTTDLLQRVRPFLEESCEEPLAARLVGKLEDVYFATLARLNAIPVKAGDIIYNATQEDFPSAEIHALGNPENKDILMVEVRRPGVTYRLWDNARFPLRPLDLERGLHGLNTRARAPESLKIKAPAPGGPAKWELVAGPYFQVSMTELPAAASLATPASAQPEVVMAIGGSVAFMGAQAENLGTLHQGQSALLPASMDDYTLVAGQNGAQLVSIKLLYQ